MKNETLHLRLMKSMILILVLAPCFVFGQTETEELVQDTAQIVEETEVAVPVYAEEPEEQIFTIVETMPEFPGGQDAHIIRGHKMGIQYNYWLDTAYYQLLYCHHWHG